MTGFIVMACLIGLALTFRQVREALLWWTVVLIGAAREGLRLIWMLIFRK